MASEVDICNIALSHLGSDAVAASISPPDGSVESGHCARFYPIARQMAIEMNAPAFARRRALLALVPNESTSWVYAYAKPTACLKPLRVLTVGAGLTVFNQDAMAIDPTEDGSAVYDIEGDVIRTNETEATLVYLTDVVDTTKFSPGFVIGLGYLLAGFLAGPIIKGQPGATAGAKWTEVAESYLRAAAASDANNSHTYNGSQVPDHLRRR